MVHPLPAGRPGPTGMQHTQGVVHQIHITSVANTQCSVFKNLRNDMIFSETGHARPSFYFHGYEPALDVYVAPGGKERGSHLYTEEPVF